MPVPIITVTGTKGKTTTVAVIADVLQKLGHNTLKVDTTGHFVNGERRSTLEDSKRTWWLVPSVCPGRYLWEFQANPSLQERGVAVLEAALGSSGPSGLGYRKHDVGVFLNVFEDHIGSSDRIQSKDDIVAAKDFVFTRLQQTGTAVFNADDEYVAKAVHAIPDGATLMPVGITFAAFDVESHLAHGGKVLTVSDNQCVVLRSQEGDEVIADLRAIPWTFNGTFTPSAWNILSAVGALYGYYKGELPVGFRKALESVRLDPYGGRLTILRNDTNVTVIADYAHEKVSMALVADLARSMVTGNGKVIGVVRLAHDRTDQLITETGEVIARKYDELIVYDKIDGYWRKAVTDTGMRFKQVEGRVSTVLTDAIRTLNPHVERIVREDEAIERAAAIARPGDVVVIIVNDDIERSIGFIQDKLKAEFV